MSYGDASSLKRRKNGFAFKDSSVIIGFADISADGGDRELSEGFSVSVAHSRAFQSGIWWCNTYYLCLFKDGYYSEEAFYNNRS
ncbi:hypothetical protein TNCV_4374071 [Trichonephila clavipes]|uniref:Uncharacterized protein n=1 Tax=Trichonephila clavipes TaxID=2585209 RepID=A0A8X6RE71_TRICX|nr:hypothetical protein TNCV_4374071 [Trichonephila clavipes]